MVAMGFVMAMTAPIEILYAHRFGAGTVAITAFVMISSVGLVTVDLFGTRVVPRLEPRASITTGMTDRISAEHKAVYARRRTALGRYGDPEEVAHITLSVCLPAASFLTGAVIPVDGGLMARNA